MNTFNMEKVFNSLPPSVTATASISPPAIQRLMKRSYLLTSIMGKFPFLLKLISLKFNLFLNAHT